ncbi:MAG: hypothetical protein MHMPM18_002449 [Marteilia pararefringens]
MESTTSLASSWDYTSCRNCHWQSPSPSGNVGRLHRMHRQWVLRNCLTNPIVPKHPTDHKPAVKAVVLRTMIVHPKKPNSGNKRCVRVRLSTGREAIAFVPGIGHSLQEHNTVMVIPKRKKDVIGVKLRCVRGVYDLPHVKKRSTGTK